MWFYTFAEGDGYNKSLLGGKGAGLCERRTRSLSDNKLTNSDRR